MREYSLLFFLFSSAFTLVVHSKEDYLFQHTKSQFGLDYSNNSMVVLCILFIAFSGVIVAVEPFNACSVLSVNLTGRIGFAIRDKNQVNCSFSQKVYNVFLCLILLFFSCKMLELSLP